MKLLYPHEQASSEEIEQLLRFAIEGRKRVKDQIVRVDTTMADVKFGYTDKAGTWQSVTTLEEDEYPEYYYREPRQHGEPTNGGVEGNNSSGSISTSIEPGAFVETSLLEGFLEFQENQRGVSFDALLIPYLRGASQVTITDPYVRQFHQARNLMELIEAIAAAKDPAEEVNVKLITSENTEGEEKLRKQLELLLKAKQGAAVAGIKLDVSFDGTIHDRSIVTDTGWRIVLGRGLDIFQYVTGDVFDLATRVQSYRQVKAFGVTYIKDRS